MKTIAKWTLILFVKYVLILFVAYVLFLWLTAGPDEIIVRPPETPDHSSHQPSQ